MRLAGVVLVAAPTSRAQAYLQALVARELCPERVIGLAGTGLRDDVTPVRERSWNGIRLPDLDESLTATCRRARVLFAACEAKNVNDGEVIAAVRDAGPKIVIYAGYGGQIVGDAMLGAGPQFLHVHSGWLPDYRGSTTIYYTLLRAEDPGVTAFILDRGIDTGSIVARRRYPKPSAGLDIDHVYDAAIRADLLVRVIAAYAENGRLPSLERQAAPDGTTYYVIHPVLKHLAILRLADARR